MPNHFITQLQIFVYPDKTSYAIEGFHSLTPAAISQLKLKKYNAVKNVQLLKKKKVFMDKGSNCQLTCQIIFPQSPPFNNNIM